MNAQQALELSRKQPGVEEVVRELIRKAAEMGHTYIQTTTMNEETKAALIADGYEVEYGMWSTMSGNEWLIDWGGAESNRPCRFLGYTSCSYRDEGFDNSPPAVLDWE